MNTALAPSWEPIADAPPLHARRRDGRPAILAAGLPCAGSITSPECFSTAVASIMRPLRGYTRRLTRDDGDDLLQETLVRAWRARSRFEPGTNFKAWLFRIARNRFLSDARRSGRSVQWNADLHDQLLVLAPAQDEALHMRDLGRALAGLPAAQREALLLVAGEGLSYEEAAHRLGQDAGTLKSRVSRARAGMMAYLDEDGTSRPEPDPIAAERPKSTRYRDWKASGSRTIG